jgi:hypothetical protein
MSKYDGPHRRLRGRLAPKVAAGNATCWRCGRPIYPGQLWHLGHHDDGVTWAGPEHALCNLKAAADKTNCQRAKVEPPAKRRHSRDW